jgi:hypothetical protein
MPTGSYSINLSIGGVNISKAINRAGDHPNPYEVSLPVGKAGSLTTRTDDDTGTITMASAEHGITTGAVVDIHWAGGVQYGVTVGTVAGTSVPFDAGSGDNLPDQSTAVVVTPRVLVNTAIDGDAIQIIGMCAEYTNIASTAAVHLDFQDAEDDSIAEIDLVANIPKVWDVAAGATNDFAGDPITKCYASNGSATEVATLKILSMEDSTP